MSYQHVPFPGSCRVFKAGTTYVSETWDGRLLASSTSGVDVVVNAAAANIPSATSGQYGGRIFMHKGDYTAVSGIKLNSETSGFYHGISLVGEGAGTKITFSPASGQILTTGVEMRMMYGQLKDMMLWANGSGIRNLVFGAGPTASTGQYNWGVVENVGFMGKDAGPPIGSAATINFSGAPVSGQVGLRLEGNLGNSYFTANWKIHNCEFFALDTGVKIVGECADMCNHSNIHIGSCRIGYEIQGVQHNLSNFRIEGGGGPVADRVGSIGIWMRDSEFSGQNGGTINLLSNINCELHNQSGICILNDLTVNNNRAVNIFNSSSDDKNAHTWVDNRTDVGTNIYGERASINPANSKSRYGVVSYGLGRNGNEQGLLTGNVKRQADGLDTTFGKLGHVNGPLAQVSTAATSGSVACVFYNNSEGNVLNTYQYPMMYTRFWPSTLTDVRIFIGQWDRYAAPTATSDLLSGRAGFGLYVDTSVSANWKFMHNDGSGASTIADFPTFTLGDLTYGPTAITNAFIHNVTTFYNNSNPSCNVRLHGCSYDFKTSNIPAVGNAMGFLIYIQNLTAGAGRTIYLQDTEYTLVTL